MKLSNSDREAARVYHQITKHSYTSVRSNPHFLDWENRPLPYKIHPTAGAIALPRELNLSTSPATEAIAGMPAASASSGALDLAMITRILFCADGLTRSKIVNGDEYHFRAAASAGALYPIEIYLAGAEIEGLEPGLYHFSPADLKLRGLRRGDCRSYLARAAVNRRSLLEARAVLIMSSIFWRSAWKYRARAYRYCFWDAGTILANVMAAANAEGIASEIVTAFEDAHIESLIDVDGDREGAVCLVPLGKANRAGPAAIETAAPPAPLNLETIALSARETTYDDLVKLHRASRLESIEEVRAVASASLVRGPAPAVTDSITPRVLGVEAATGLGETILRRGSTRTFAREPIDATELATIMATARPRPPGDLPSAVETWLIVNAIDGIEPGAYFYNRDTGDFDLIKRGNFRDEAGYLSLEQALGADCSALICYMTDLEKLLEACGNRGYRDAHLEAGVLAGRAYLAAYSLGRGATGLTFYDDDTTKFFTPDLPDKAPLLMVALGVPKPRTRSPTGDEG